MTTVYVVTNARGQLMCIFAKRTDAETKCARYNEDDGEGPDNKKPYGVMPWGVLQSTELSNVI